MASQSKNVTSTIPATEFDPYYKKYLDLAPDLSLEQALAKGLEETEVFFKNMPKPKWAYRYAEGKWTPKQVLLHLIDTERVFGYRALYFARSNSSELKGYDQDIFVENSRADERPAEQLLDEYRTVRLATLSLFKGFDDLALQKVGKANGSLMSVRAAGYVVCGHEIHHRNILTERYL